jgi:serine/threonine protein kinase
VREWESILSLQHTSVMETISLSSGNKLAGRYRVLQKLGEGSFAETFLAEDELLPDSFRCVIKKLKTGVEEDSKLQIAKRLFDAEARTLHQLGSHIQIPQLLAHFEEDSEFYLVEEYVQGGSLYQELAAGQKWSEGYVIKLLQDILEVLSFVHQKQVIHRDIKPSNIIRREHDGKVVLIDFGAVKQVTNQVVDDNSMASPHTVIVGTPGYMPGEQLRGSPRTSSDVYAVGMIAIYALTGLNPALGQLPEDDATAEILWHEHTAISPELTAILDKMVAYDFRQRYPSATEALDAMHALRLHRQEDAPTILKEASGPIGIPGGSGITPAPRTTGSAGSGSTGATGSVGSAPRNSGIIINTSAMGSGIGSSVGSGVGNSGIGNSGPGSGVGNSGIGSGIGNAGNSGIPPQNVIQLGAGALEQTSIGPIEPMTPTTMGTYAVSDAPPAQVAKAATVAPAGKRRRLNLKLLALGGAGVVALGAIATLASPNIEPICKALNNCSAEVTYNSLYETARDSAESALTAVKGAKSLGDLEKASGQLQKSVQQLTKIPDAVGSYGEVQKVLPTYQKQMKSLSERITFEKKAQQDLKQAKSIVNKFSTKKKLPTSVAGLSENRAQIQQALQRLDKIPDNSLSAQQKKVERQAYQQQIKTYDQAITKQSAVEAEQRRAAPVYQTPAYTGGGGSSYTPSGGGSSEPLWGNDAPAQQAPAWGPGSGSSTAANSAPPPAQEEPLWGGGNGGGGNAAPPAPADNGSGGGDGGGGEPLW